MTLPIADTPLAARLAMPARRADAWNPSLEAAIYPAPGQEAILARLRTPGALVVTTGQQPGVLTGPSYAVTKALSARGVALALERRWGVPVVPIYWVPGDDHDFDEVAGVKWIAWDGSLLAAALPPRPPGAPLAPMYRQPLGPPIADVLKAFEQSFPEGAPRDETVGWLRRHYRPDQTVGHAFGRAMAELLAPLGVLCLDGSHRAVKVAAGPVVLRALEHAAAIEAVLVARAAALTADHRAAPVLVGDGASLVFLEGPDGRDRLVMAGSGFITRKGKAAHSLEDLRRIAEAEPERLSANVLLRPIVESAILPTVSYSAGPGELRYLALAEPVYALLGVPRQQPLPRWSGFLVEPRVTRILEKFETSLDQLRAPGNALETRLAKAALPDGTEAAMTALRNAIDTSYPPVVRAAIAVDPNLERPANSAKAQAVFALDKLEKKLLRHSLKRQEVELAQLTRARTSLRPDGKPQERVLSMAGFLARHGMGVLPAMAAHIEAWHAAALEAAPPTA